MRQTTRRRARFLESAAVGLLFVVAGCSSNGSDGPQAVSPPVVSPPSAPVVIPTITTLAPAAIAAGSAPFTLTVSGANFRPGSTVRWNGTDRPTTYISTTQLSATIAATDLAAMGTAQVTVITPNPGGGTSTAATFSINAPQFPVPAITSIDPANVMTELTGLALTVNGTGFIADSVARWNGADRSTIVRSSTQLMIALLPADNAVAGNAQVSVSNPAPGGLSGSLGVTVVPVVTFARGVTDRISVSSTSREGDGWSSDGAISNDGRYIAFSSTSGNLVAGDTNNRSDVFVRDTCRGTAGGCTPSTTRISLATGGAQGNGDSFAPVISASGRFVVFESQATNLAAGDGNGVADVFLRDTCAGAVGCTPSTMVVSVASDGSQAGAQSLSASISADGRFVAFVSSATNLVPGDTNAKDDVFVRDTCIGAGGCVPSIARVSLTEAGTEADGASASPTLSASGRRVSFESRAANLVAGDTNNVADVFVRDTCAGAVGCTPSTLRVSLESAGAQAIDDSFLPAISGNGRHVAFTSWSPNLVTGDSNGGHDVFVRDTCFEAVGACTPSTLRVSVADNGSQADAPSGGPATGGASISADGRFVAFGSRATNLVTGDTNGAFDIFLRDTCAGAAGCTPSTTRQSVAVDGTQSASGQRSDGPALSADGRYITFASDSTTFLPGDSNATADIFLAKTGVP